MSELHTDPPEELAEAEEQEAPQYDEEVVERAREYGWKPKEEWVGNPPPHGFKGPDEYLELPSIQLRVVNDELAKTREQVQEWSSRYDTDLAEIRAAHQHAQKIQKEHHQRTLDELRRDQRAAAEEGDMERYDRVQKTLDDMGQVPVQPQEQSDPIAAKWWADHPHIGQDPFLASEVDRIAGQVAARGGGIEAQIAGVERFFKATYSDVELKSNPKPKPKPRTVVDGGGLGVSGGDNTGWDSLGAEVRKVADELIEDGVFDYAGSTKAEKRAAYFETYKREVLGQ